MQGQPSTGTAGKVSLCVGKPFNPYGLFNGILIPEAICKYRGLSLGAKMVYGRLCRYAGRDGLVYPSIPTLASELGVGKTQARKYVQKLESEHFIAVDRKNRHFGPNGTGGTNNYVFLWHAAFEGQCGKLRKVPPVRKTGDVRLRKTGPLPLRKTGDEESHHQESQDEESQSCAPVKLAESGKANQNLLVSFSADDDEKQREGPAYGSPWEELDAESRKASKGAEMSYEDKRWLKEQMEIRRISPEGLLELVRTNPLSKFDSPMAGLKWLVKRFRGKTRSAADVSVGFGAGNGLSQVDNPRCEKCGNTGRIVERVEGYSPTMTDEYCDCPMGKDLRVAERRKDKALLTVNNTVRQIPPNSSITT